LARLGSFSVETKVDWFDRGIKVVTLLVATGALIVASYQLHVASSQLKKLTDNVDVAIKSLGVSLLSNSASHTIDLSKTFLQNPEMRRYFYEGEDIKETDPRYPKVKSFGFLILDVFDATRPLAIQAASLPDRVVELDAWDRYYDITFRRSRTARFFVSSS
jgi:hypothetical protein